MSNCPAKAQAQQTDFLAVPLLPVKAVRIDSGTTVHRDLVGFTPVAYKQLRAEMAAGERLLVVRSGDLAVVRNLHRNDSLTMSSRSQEIQRLRGMVATRDAELTAQEQRLDRVLSRPLQKPLLLDRNTWLGLLAGAVAGAVLVLSH